MMKDKVQQQKIINSIQTILLQNWDPIDIGDNPNLKDEYDGYIGKIINILLGSPSVEEIIDLFRKIEKDMGVYSDTKTLYSLALRLKNIDMID
jgi:hypothetical protein